MARVHENFKNISDYRQKATMSKWHQNITIDGVDQPSEYRNRKNSAFFNEGKWNNFIKPLLPKDPQDRTFIEIGCNVGLYLKLATEYGFRNVIGVETDPDNCAMAEKYRDANGMHYKVLNRTVGKDFSFDELPVADVVLMSNMHYYIHMSYFVPFLDMLLNKTVDCIMVSRHMNEKKHGYPLPEIEPIRLMFRDWELLRVLQTSSQMLDKDPHKRTVHSMLFRSRLQRQSIMDYVTRTQKYVKQQELIDIIREGRDVKLEDTINWAYWKQRKQTEKSKPQDMWSDEQIRAHVQLRFDLVESIMKDGMKEPILVHPDRTVIDGGNRAQILKLLGYKSIIVRII
jgi:SAM-dependent methyltransferase